MIDLNTRIAYATSMPNKNIKYTALALKALLQGIKMYDKDKISILTDNGIFYISKNSKTKRTLPEFNRTL